MGPKIEKGIPIPNALLDNLPLLKMEVGDSFYTEAYSVFQISNAYSKARRKAKNIELRWTAAKEKKGYRVWRTA